jgi:ribosome-associated toxin RatA of RatAB toxin-antitoxin module
MKRVTRDLFRKLYNEKYSTRVNVSNKSWKSFTSLINGPQTQGDWAFDNVEGCDSTIKMNLFFQYENDLILAKLACDNIAE